MILTACTDSTTRATVTGDFQAIKQSAQRSDFDLASLDMNEVWAFCQAFTKARTFDSYDKCMVELERRVAANEGNLIYMVQGLFDAEFTAYGAHAEGMIKTLKSEAAQARGDEEGAYELAAEIAALTTTYAYPGSSWTPVVNERYAKLSEYEEAWFFWIERLKHQAQALGRQGLIAARWGDETTARKFARQIEAVDDSSNSAEQWYLPETKALWLGRIYLALEDYDAAYAATHKADDFGFFEIISGANAVMQFINPVMMATMVELTGSADPYALDFVSEFEPQFMRHLTELETGRLAEAKEGYAEILADDRVRGFGTLYWQALHGRGRIAALEGSTAAAVRDFETAIDVIESQRRSLDTEAGRIGFVGDKQRVYGDLIKLLIESGRADEAFAYAERAKARALVDLLASKEALGSEVLSPQQSTLLTKFDAQEETLTAQSRASGTANTRSANTARATLIQQDPSLASLVTVEAFSAEELQALIPADETAIEYYLEGDRLFVFVVTRNSVSAKVLSSKDLARRVSQFRRALGRPGSDAFAAPGRALYEQLIAPIASQVTTEKVTIVPHGSLHYLSWVAIPAGDGFLLDHWSVRILPSASVLQFVGGTASPDAALLALGNPDTGDPQLDLPGAELETQAVASSVPGARALLRRDATETALRSQARTAKTLHIASHGVFQPTDPLASALVLSPDSTNDGRLTVAEIYGLDLDADLVTLSACETGLGRVQNGDDVIGLTRGFLFSGAKSVIASQWLIDDAATATLMKEFYAYRAKGSSREALRFVQSKIKDSYNAHPYYWAAFQLTGGDI
ncbi:MAG: CHAT domain-containing protein [Pseudomonadota bacterium]